MLMCHFYNIAKRSAIYFCYIFLIYCILVYKSDILCFKCVNLITQLRLLGWLLSLTEHFEDGLQLLYWINQICFVMVLFL